MRRVFAVILSLFLLALSPYGARHGNTLLGSAAEASTEGAGESIDGTWLPAMAELAGKPFPDKVLKTIKLVVMDGKYVAFVSGKADKGTIKLDPSAKPRTLDIIGTEGPNKDKTILAIYELSNDTLRICYDLSGKQRPAEFTTSAGTQRFLVTYRREKS